MFTHFGTIRVEVRGRDRIGEARCGEGRMQRIYWASSMIV